MPVNDLGRGKYRLTFEAHISDLQTVRACQSIANPPAVSLQDRIFLTKMLHDIAVLEDAFGDTGRGGGLAQSRPLGSCQPHLCQIHHRPECLLLLVVGKCGCHTKVCRILAGGLLHAASDICHRDIFSRWCEAKLSFDLRRMEGNRLCNPAQTLGDVGLHIGETHHREHLHRLRIDDRSGSGIGDKIVLLCLVALVCSAHLLRLPLHTAEDCRYDPHHIVVQHFAIPLDICQKCTVFQQQRLYAARCRIQLTLIKRQHATARLYHLFEIAEIRLYFGDVARDIFFISGKYHTLLYRTPFGHSSHRLLCHRHKPVECKYRCPCCQEQQRELHLFCHPTIPFSIRTKPSLSIHLKIVGGLYLDIDYSS